MVCRLDVVGQRGRAQRVGINLARFGGLGVILLQKAEHLVDVEAPPGTGLVEWRLAMATVIDAQAVEDAGPAGRSVTRLPTVA